MNVLRTLYGAHYNYHDSSIFYLCFARTPLLKINARTKTLVKMIASTQPTVFCILLHLGSEVFNG